MKRFAAVALREIVERRFVLAAAAVAAVLPFLVPLLPGIPGGDVGMARAFAGLVLASTFGLGGALLVGASVVGRELAERRFSFHFSRPLAAPVVWGGKLAGGLAIVLLAELVVVLPSSLASGGFPGLTGLTLDTPVLWGVLLCAVPCFLVAWAGSVAMRSRSPWLVVDLVLLAAVPALLYVLGRRLVRFGHELTPSMGVAAVGVLVVALLAATLAQVVAGRPDARRGHGAQSLVLWGILLVATAASAAWTGRVVDPGVERLVRAWAEPAGPAGTWVVVEGSARESGGGGARYLLNLVDGRSLLLVPGWTTIVSSDGSRAVHAYRPTSDPKSVELETIDLKTGETAVLDLPEWPEGFALSADGRRLAVVVGGVCRVVDLPSLDLLASARVPTAQWAYVPRFASPDRVRLFPNRQKHRELAMGTPPPAPDPEAAELDVTARSVATLARYPVSSLEVRSAEEEGTHRRPFYFLLPSPDLSRVLLVGLGSARGVRLLDAATGRILASVDPSNSSDRPLAAFLADGRVVAFAPGAGRPKVLVLAADGGPSSELTLPEGTTSVQFGYELSPGLLAVGVRHGTVNEERKWLVADLGTGAFRPLPVRALPQAWWFGEDLRPPPGSPATRIAWQEDTGRLVLYDPATGATKPITRGRPAGK